MKPGQIVLIAYALVLLAGGTAGFVKGSTASLIAAGTLGVLSIASFVVSRKNLTRGYYAGFGIAVVAAGGMGKRWAESGKFMPAGMVVVLSVFVAILLLARAKRDAKSE